MASYRVKKVCKYAVVYGGSHLQEYPTKKSATSAMHDLTGKSPRKRRSKGRRKSRKGSPLRKK